MLPMGEIPITLKRLALTANLFTFGCSSFSGAYVPKIEGSIQSPEPRWAAPPAEYGKVNYQPIPVENNLGDYVETLRANPTITVLGDSITYLGFGEAFKREAKAIGLSHVTAIGYGGYGSSMILEGFDAPKLKERVYLGAPDVLIVQLGANDVWRSSHSPAEFAENIAAIIARARERNSNVHVIVMPVYPMDTNNDGTLDADVKRVATNQEFAAMSVEHSTWQSPIVFIEEGSRSDDYFDTVDGIHPTSSEAILMTRRPLEIILSWISEK
jgi:lysophospholipase L1-like esterase